MVSFAGMLLVPHVGDFRARQVKVSIGSLLILVITYLFVDWMQTRGAKSLVLVGLFWFVLTLLLRSDSGALLQAVPGRMWSPTSISRTVRFCRSDWPS